MPTQPASGGDDVVATMVPYKNVPALVGYYLGVFSLIPLLGIPLGIGAVICGILGLRRAGENPQSKGKVHAWIAIVLGGLTSMGWIGALAFFGAGKR
ncbi:MAG: hypothetical protein DVB31_07685 [Verrucomicrobia bacterium]|nr:MAG: hypothetical protein DVB31_07685 [Verrucomicrobiota bacterium]